MGIKSPITGKENVTYIQSILVEEIYSIYKKILPTVDTSKVFKDLKEIKLYECNETKYRFYWPLDITGNDKYYAELGQLGWYYSTWKWEHEVSLKHIKAGDKVLEVGAAKGDFLKRLKEKLGAEVIGLELNAKAEEYANQAGLPILNQSIQDYSLEHSNQFDVVCSYQVLEHISEVRSFLVAKIKCIKKGGKLIISVPNNDSFISRNKLNSRVLNQPPHHLGLWNEESLKSIASLFNLTYLGKDIEPLQEIHQETYVMTKFYDWFKSDLIVKILWKLKITTLLKPLILWNKESIIGHSINVYFIKD